MNEKVLEIINGLLTTKGLSTLVSLDKDLKLRDDIGFTSFDLAELTVKLEDEFDVDIFENGIIENVGEVLEKLNK